MTTVAFDDSWPDSGRLSYAHDLKEVYGQDTDRGYTYAYHNRQSAAMRLIETALPRGCRLLDVGAAQGNLSLPLAEKGYRVTWNDLRADLVGYVQLKYEAGDITYDPRDVFDITCDSPFDAVIIGEIIEHVAHPDVFLSKVASLTKPGGYVVMTTPNGGYFSRCLPRFSDCPDPAAFESQQYKPDADGHIFLLWPDEVETLAQQAGLRVDKLEFITTPFLRGHFKSRFLLNLLPRSCAFALEGSINALPARLRSRIMMHTVARLRKPDGSPAGN